MNPWALAVTIVLAALSALHLYWGLGGRWPGHDEHSMVERVVGRTQGMKAPGFWPAFFVAAALAVSAVLVAVVGGLVPGPDQPLPAFAVATGFWGSGAVFALRGLAGFSRTVFGYAAGTPFMRLNRLFYSPLCLAIAAGYVAAYLAG
ncbi:DUF3995 domain-containing protein [Zavarzinia compransoris]|uniref:DUF3995 domain-containing protein n=1 Tax=Zavarzinia compransoris TaxID=1264899 RepID=A0A317E2N1_9PROT|nr:DUF3995 domain-containing protein [Zavarzinia compransoris]PWR20871.1 DUF3995 domain-containing protein [Zavarzinia compransoris]TDP44293.1 uncharacterized protein DUF3995 [Zavarzinia compransoris]